MITAPYNFVPLNSEVFYPSWAEQISHDVPFSDAESGEIDITITAKSPIFIRDSKNKEQFCNHNGEYYIPSTSIKGMIRNVLEIMSFSKMSFLSDTRYSIRDLKYTKYMDRIKKDIRCGWLYNEGNKLLVEDCGEPCRISYDEMDKEFSIKFKSHFMKGTFDNSKSPLKNAHEKYTLLKKLSSQDIIGTLFSFSEPVTQYGKKIVTFEKNSKNVGNIVLTGHPSSRDENKPKPTGKIYDFVFLKSKNESILEVPEEVFKNFKFAYFDGRKTQPEESPDWTFWKDKLEQGERVPVFFHKNITGVVTSFGLSYLYKFPYEYSIMQLLSKNHTSSKLDLAESIFGYSKKINDTQHSLKGRVMFSHAKVDNTSKITPLKSRYILLGSPKASYYPIYLVQNGKEYKTLMDSNAMLAGWKRYPIHRHFKHKCDGESNLTSNVIPLNSGCSFRSKIRIHNLKPIEIGALISALTFHDTKECFHSIGMGKSLGYGKIKIAINGLKNLKYSKTEYMQFFESCVNSELSMDGKAWHESEQIKNLYTMASEQDDSNLKYMELGQFAKAKNQYYYLDRYINLDEVNSVSVKSLSSEQSIEEYNLYIKLYKEIQAKIELQEKEAKQKEEQVKELQKTMDKSWKKASESKDINLINTHLSTYPDYEKNSKLKERLVILRQEAQKEQEDRFATIDQNATRAWEAVLAKKGNQKQFTKEVEGFIKKWSQDRHSKKSPEVAKLVEEARKLEK